MYRENFENNFLLRKEFVTVSRITALWAFSEAAFGGILHALKIPFTGLFIGGAAIVFLCLIAHFSTTKSQIFQSTLVVILVKGIVSPHSPLTAYFAVFIQGGLAFLFFSFLRPHKVAAFLLGVTALSLAAFQKVIVLTVLFGMTIWESIDTFGNYVFNEFLLEGSGDFQLSYILIGIYSGIHIVGGVVFGIIGGKMPNWISKNSYRAEEYNDLVLKQNDSILTGRKKGRKKRAWWQRKSGITFLIFSAAMILLAYFNPQLDDNLIFNILLMLIRSLVVTYLWFGLLSPIVIKLVKKYLTKKKSQYSGEIDYILSLFPYFKGIINYSWEETKSQKNYKRIIPFLKNSFILLLMADIDSYEKSNSI